MLNWWEKNFADCAIRSLKTHTGRKETRLEREKGEGKINKPNFDNL